MPPSLHSALAQHAHAPHSHTRPSPFETEALQARRLGQPTRAPAEHALCRSRAHFVSRVPSKQARVCLIGHGGTPAAAHAVCAVHRLPRGYRRKHPQVSAADPARRRAEPATLWARAVEYYAHSSATIQGPGKWHRASPHPRAASGASAARPALVYPCPGADAPIARYHVEAQLREPASGADAVEGTAHRRPGPSTSIAELPTEACVCGEGKKRAAVWSFTWRL